MHDFAKYTQYLKAIFLCSFMDDFAKYTKYLEAIFIMQYILTLCFCAHSLPTVFKLENSMVKSRLPLPFI